MSDPPEDGERGPDERLYMQVIDMKASEILSLLHDEVRTDTPSPSVALPFRPGSEYRGTLPRYGEKVPAGPHGLWLEILEDGGELGLSLSSSNAEWANRVAWVVIRGDHSNEDITAKMVLKPSATGYAARIDLGSTADLQEELGTNLRWTVFPPRELAKVAADPPPRQPQELKKSWGIDRKMPLSRLLS